LGRGAFWQVEQDGLRIDVAQTDLAYNGKKTRRTHRRSKEKELHGMD
jgi:hypothetical protein